MSFYDEERRTFKDFLCSTVLLSHLFEGESLHVSMQVFLMFSSNKEDFQQTILYLYQVEKSLKTKLQSASVFPNTDPNAVSV